MTDFIPHHGEPQVLRPYHRSEAINIADAAAIAGRSVRTVRDWCLRHDLGRIIGGQWAVSKVALAMWLDGNDEALRAYLAGDRSSPTVTRYFEQCDVPRPKRLNEIREDRLSEPNALRESRP